ncbi:unnamed protein product, partial [Iphiclides podalirius]
MYSYVLAESGVCRVSSSDLLGRRAPRARRQTGLWGFVALGRRTRARYCRPLPPSHIAKPLKKSTAYRQNTVYG